MNYYISRDKLIVDGEPVPDEVTPPSLLDMIEADRETNDKMLRVQFYSSMPKEVKRSSFQAFGVEISSVEDVDVAYMRIRHMNKNADHIMVGYRLRKEGEIVHGGVSDKEHYGDQEVLTAILKAQAVNVAVFVAREYGGIPLCGLRFESIKEVSNEVLRMMTFQPRRNDRAGRGSETSFKSCGQFRPIRGRQGQNGSYYGSKGRGRGKYTDGNYDRPGSSNPTNRPYYNNNYSQRQTYAQKAGQDFYNNHSRSNNQDRASSSSASDID